MRRSRYHQAGGAAIRRARYLQAGGGAVRRTRYLQAGGGDVRRTRYLQAGGGDVRRTLDLQAGGSPSGEHVIFRLVARHQENTLSSGWWRAIRRTRYLQAGGGAVRRTRCLQAGGAPSGEHVVFRLVGVT